jgi:hypothetical protein
MPAAVAMYPKTTLGEMVRQADAIFVGTVVRQESRAGTNTNMIFTDVELAVTQWIGGRTATPGAAGGKIVLTFAGGQVGEQIVRVSDVPVLEAGATYMLFARMDGKTYASPILGGFQGLFRVLADEVDGRLYPIAYGGQYVTGFKGEDLTLGPAVQAISQGKPVLKDATTPFVRHDVAPQPVTTGAAGSGAARVSAVAGAAARPPVGLDEFIREVQTRLGAQ